MNSRTAAPVCLILDRSAILGYLAASMHVAEVLHEIVEDEGVRFGVPALVLAETVNLVDPADAIWIRELADLDACVVLPVLASEWAHLSVWVGYLKRLDLAATVRAAVVSSAPILTSEPGLYAAPEPVSLISFPG